MTQQTENITLKSFFIYNSTFGPNEGEEEKKILYYYPNNVNLETQIKDVGLSEAIVKFTNTFTPDESCESLHTQKTRQIFFQPEKDFWMIMTVNVPHVFITKESVTYCEYHGDEVQDSVLQAVLKQSYETYKLFRGSFLRSLCKGVHSQDTSILKLELNKFFSKYLLTLKLPYCDVLDIMQGMQLMPLDALSFLKVQTFVNLLEATFPIIQKTSFLYNELLVWSGIESCDMQIIYTYLLNSHILPAQLEHELQKCFSTQSNDSRNSSSHLGQFVNVSLINGGLESKECGERFTIINLIDGNEYKLLVYKLNCCTVCLFIDACQSINQSSLDELKSFMGVRLIAITSDITNKCLETDSRNQQTNSNSIENEPKYLFYNDIEKAYKSTLHKDCRKMGNLSVSQEAMKLIADMHGEIDYISKETILKTSNDHWVIGNFSNHRHFYVVLHQKNTNLIEISSEFRRICDKELKYIYFQKL